MVFDNIDFKNILFQVKKMELIVYGEKCEKVGIAHVRRFIYS